MRMLRPFIPALLVSATLPMCWCGAAGPPRPPKPEAPPVGIMAASSAAAPSVTDVAGGDSNRETYEGD